MNDSPFAERLEYLFRNVHPAERGPWTSGEVASGLRARGCEISDVQMWKLRTGRARPPRIDLVEALADFFGVSAAYFVDDDRAADIQRQIELIVEMRERQVDHIALRALEDLSPQGRDLIMDMITRLRQMEERPPGEEHS